MSPTMRDLHRLRDLAVDSDDDGRLVRVRAGIRRARRRRQIAGVAAGALGVAATVTAVTLLSPLHRSPAGLQMTPAASPTATQQPTNTPATVNGAPPARPRTESGASSTSAAAATSAPSVPAPAPVTVCPTSHLRLTVGAPGGAAGSSYYPLEFQNVGASACRLTGYPGVSFLDGKGQQVGRPADREPPTGAPVVLAPGAYAHATLRVINAYNYPTTSCSPQTARSLRVFPPENVDSVVVSHQFLVCTTRSSTTVTVVLPGRSSQ